MTPEELKQFNDRVATPAMQRLLDSAKLEEGMCFIEKINLSYIDGRSWGHDCSYKAEGLLYQDGKVQPFEVDVVDEEFPVFIKSLNGCYVLGDAEVLISDELNESEIKTSFRCVGLFDSLYGDIRELREMPCCSQVPEYLKMQKLFRDFGSDFLVSFEEEPNKQMGLSELEDNALGCLYEEVNMVINDSFREEHCIVGIYDSSFLFSRVDDSSVGLHMLVEMYGDELIQLKNQVQRAMAQKSVRKNLSLEEQISDADCKKAEAPSVKNTKDIER